MKIFADPQQLESTASLMEQQVMEYERLYQQLYMEVDKMQAAWKGKDNLAYTDQIRNFSTDFQNMKLLMQEYVAFLKKSAELYADTQNELVQKARLLRY